MTKYDNSLAAKATFREVLIREHFYKSCSGPSSSVVPFFIRLHYIFLSKDNSVFQETTACEGERPGSHGKNNIGLCIKTIKNY